MKFGSLEAWEVLSWSAQVSAGQRRSARQARKAESVGGEIDSITIFARRGGCFTPSAACLQHSPHCMCIVICHAAHAKVNQVSCHAVDLLLLLVVLIVPSSPLSFSSRL